MAEKLHQAPQKECSLFSRFECHQRTGNHSQNLELVAKITDQFVPFTATHNYRFSCAHTRDAYERLSDEEKEWLPWDPENIDWYKYILETHVPGIREHVFPLIEDKKNREQKPLRPYDHLLDLVDEMADRYGHQSAFMYVHEDGFASISYLEFQAMTHNIAHALCEKGVKELEICDVSRSKTGNSNFSHKVRQI